MEDSPEKGKKNAIIWKFYLSKHSKKYDPYGLLCVLQREERKVENGMQITEDCG